MDRFIVVSMLEQIMPLIDLKSNMDRFIESVLSLILVIFQDLKSNMDRFIDVSIIFNTSMVQPFKIQYG